MALRPRGKLRNIEVPSSCLVLMRMLLSEDHDPRRLPALTSERASNKRFELMVVSCTLM
ncbi:hypothetical protein DPMN_129918 [Dreissena polymorpha]|uniref:Uncharacterized protein n=1 Tax=Dreissena polymorpha TaxID=45954 RepID=A0A9D4H9Z7_DREPO|nr:hypothetical protein DPMN_129918 [Dreissena polymorpha]